MKKIEKALKKYKEFNNREPKEVKKVDVKLPDVWTLMGNITSISYESEKEGFKAIYEHKFDKKNPPQGYFDENGKMILIIGGKFKIKDWIYD